MNTDSYFFMTIIILHPCVKYSSVGYNYTDFKNHSLIYLIRSKDEL